MLKLPQGTEKCYFRYNPSSLCRLDPLKNGCGSTSSTFFLLTRGIRRRLWQMRCSTAERYKEAAVIQCSIDDLTARMIVEYKAPEIEITCKGFRPDYPLQHGAESGLSDCQQRASALLLSHRLRAQQLYFSAGYTRVSKLIGGATNNPLPLSSHRIIYHA